ncbi:MAG TPA: hypothetical protein DDZ66_13975 [Firmicutes bacterium]|nr:hypothetical protein [Bacillota bacterium]
MLIKIRHPKFSCVELRDGSLVIHSMQGKARVLQENVADVAVVVNGEAVRIVGFLDKTYAWYFSGTEDLRSERIEFDQLYGGGGRLINDGLGNSHLFYFAKQSVGHGAQLRHLTFSDQWGIAQTVSINVFAERSSLSASWNSDGYVHLVYCGHSHQHLLYRVYNLEHRLWSGAVVFSEERCSNPQFIPTKERLYLFWQEEKEKTILRVRHKEEHWSPITRVSSGKGHVSNVGYSFENDQWKVLWGEESGFYAAHFDHWSDRKALQREDFDYVWMVEGMHTIAVYEEKEDVREVTPEPKVIPQTALVEPAVESIPDPEPVPEPTPELEPTPQERAQTKRESEEAKLQAAFVEQAFRTLQEWEKVREEMAHWKREFRLPEPLDLNPLLTRVERLERRILSLQHSHEQSKKLWEENFAQVEQGITRTKNRLRDLEEVGKNKERSLWQRVLGRG